MMEEIEEDEFRSGIEKDDGIKIGIQRPATTKEHWSNCAEKKQDFEHYADGKGQEFNVHVASIL